MVTPSEDEGQEVQGEQVTGVGVVTSLVHEGHEGHVTGVGVVTSSEQGGHEAGREVGHAIALPDDCTILLQVSP